MSDELKVLSSDTRLNILNELKERPTTASFLSKSLNKHVTTVSEHLEKLQDAGLVERQEKPGRKFVFYSLTQRGRRTVGATINIKTLLSGVLVSILAISYIVFLFMNQSTMITETIPLQKPVGGVEPVGDLEYIRSKDFNSFLLYMVPIFIGLFILGIIFGIKVVKSH